MKNYGKELILDLHEVENIHLFNRRDLKKFLIELCDLIDMNREDLHFWDYEGRPEDEIPKDSHLLGTTAVQFITTSNIVIHTLDLLQAVYVNVFSCKKYDTELAERITKEWFGAKDCRTHFIERL